MRVLGPFLTVLASAMTLLAATVRLWWAKPSRSGPQDTPRRDVPSWVSTAAKWWLIVLLFGGAIIVTVIVVLTLIDLST